MLDARAILRYPPAVQRILVWCALGCVLVCDTGRWRLDRPAGLPWPCGPAPKPIQDRTAQAAIAAGARVGTAADLFARAA